MDDLLSSLNSLSIVWIPCIPDYSTGTYTPIYNLGNMPQSVLNNIARPIPRGGLKNKSWSHDEDDQLKKLVEKHGLKSWTKIATILNQAFKSNRKGKNCRERWINHLDPNMNKGEWSYEEDLFLLTKQKQLGRKWSLISKQLSGRTENSVKNRWNVLIKGFQQSVGSTDVEMATEYLINHISSLLNH